MVQMVPVASIAELRRGDIVAHKRSGNSYVIDRVDGMTATGLDSIEISNPAEWLIAVEGPRGQLPAPPASSLRAAAARAGSRLSAEDRYLRDPFFHYLVDNMQAFLAQHDYTPTELREAAILAATLHDARTLRRTFLP